MNKYDDIINLPHHVSKVHKPMSMESRAAQFASFAALKGFETSIEEEASLPHCEDENYDPDFY